MLRHQNIPSSYIVLIKDHKVLLSRRFQTGYEDGKYSLVAGRVEVGEAFTQCVIREAEEEAGILLKPEEIRVAHVMHRNSQTEDIYERVDVFFVADNWNGEIMNKERAKCDDLAWFDLNSLPENTIPYIKQAIEAIQNKLF